MRQMMIGIGILVGVLMAAVVVQTAKAGSQRMGTVTVPLQLVNVDEDPEEEAIRADLTFYEDGAVTGDIIVWQRKPLRRELFHFERSEDEPVDFTVVFTDPDPCGSDDGCLSAVAIGNINIQCPCNTRGESGEDVPIEFYFDDVDVNDPKNTPRYRFIALANILYFDQ